MYDYFDEPYYEPTPADEIFYEAQSKLMNCLKDSIKFRVDSIQKENERLKKENEEMKNKVRNIEWKENNIKSREENMAKNVMRGKFSEIFKPLEEKLPLWRIDYRKVYGAKCNKCNDDRKIVYTTPLGNQREESCDCSKTYRYFYPSFVEIQYLQLYKKTNYPYTLSITPEYESARYDDTYCKFKLNRYIENLDDFITDEVLKDLADTQLWNYTEVGFVKKEDCQRFANYLNKKNGLPDAIYEIEKKNPSPDELKGNIKKKGKKIIR